MKSTISSQNLELHRTDLSSPNREEEEDGLGCLSFRDLAGDICTDSLLPPYTDGDLEFEFLPVVIPDSSALAQVSFYPVFGVDGYGRQAKMDRGKNRRSMSSKIEKCKSTEATGRFLSRTKSVSFRLEKCMSTAPTGRSMSGWRRVLDLLIGKKSNDGNDSMKKVLKKDNRKRLTYLTYRSNLTALFPVKRKINSGRRSN